ncbi:uncharacterized protein J5F26_013430 [Ciconia maguari]
MASRSGNTTKTFPTTKYKDMHFSPSCPLSALRFVKLLQTPEKAYEACSACMEKLSLPQGREDVETTKPSGHPWEESQKERGEQASPWSLGICSCSEAVNHSWQELSSPMRHGGWCRPHKIHINPSPVQTVKLA